MAKLGIVGCGMIADLLLKGAREAGLDVACVCDVDRRKAELAAFPFGAKVVTDYDALLANSDVDAVIVALPNDMHLEYASRALDAGKHVFCEKPMTTCPTDSLKLVEKVRASGRVFQVGYMKRFNPAFIAVKERLANVEPILNASFLLTITGEPPLEGKAPTPGSWHGDVKRSGGGFLIHSGSHLTDLIIFLFGLPERAWGHLEKDLAGNEYTNNFLLKMRSGFFVYFQLCFTKAKGLGYTGTGWHERVEVIGRHGRLFAADNDWQGIATPIAEINLGDADGPQRLETSGISHWAEELKAFVKGIAEGKCLGSSVVDGYHVDCVLDQLKQLEKGEDIITFRFETE